MTEKPKQPREFNVKQQTFNQNHIAQLITLDALMQKFSEQLDALTKQHFINAGRFDFNFTIER